MASVDDTFQRLVSPSCYQNKVSSCKKNSMTFGIYVYFILLCRNSENEFRIFSISFT